VLVCGIVLHLAVRSNRLDPSLRVAAFITVGVLAGGFFLFGWWGEYASRSLAMNEARRTPVVLHANQSRLMVETAGPTASVETPTSEIQTLRVTVRPVTGSGRLRSPRVPFLEVGLRDGSRHLLLGGHHPAELQWVAAALAQSLQVSAESAGIA
jgi:hypothetical protein